MARGGGGGSTVHYNVTRVRSPPLRRAGRVIERNVPYRLLLLLLLFPATVKSNFAFIYTCTYYSPRWPLALDVSSEWIHHNMMGDYIIINTHTHPTESAPALSAANLQTANMPLYGHFADIFRNFLATTLSFLDADAVSHRVDNLSSVDCRAPTT